MKRFIALVLALVMVLSLGACKKNTESTPERTTPTQAPTVAPTAAPTTAPTAAPTVAPTAVPTVAPTAAPTEPAEEAAPLEKLAVALLTTLSDKVSFDQEGPVSTNVRVDLSKIAAALGMELDAVVDLTCYEDVENAAAAFVLNTELNKEALADLGLGLSEDSIVLSSKTLLGDKLYGISLTDFTDNLPKSVLNPANGSSLALPQQIYDMLINGDEKIEEFMPSEELLELLGRDVESLSKIFSSWVVTGITISDEEGEITLESQLAVEGKAVAGKTVKADFITVSVNGEQLSKLLNDLLEWLRTSAEAKATIEQIAKEYADTLKKQDMDPATLYTDLQDALKDINADVDKELTVGITFAVDAKTNTIIRTLFAVKSAQLSLELSATTLENSEERCAAEYSISIDDGIAPMDLGLTFTMDKKTGVFTVNAMDIIVLTGTYKTAGKVTTLSLDTLTIDQEDSAITIKDLGIVITTTRGVKLPDFGKFTELLTMKEDDLGSVIMNVMDASEGVMGKIGAILGFGPEDPIEETDSNAVIASESASAN